MRHNSSPFTQEGVNTVLKYIWSNVEMTIKRLYLRCGLSCLSTRDFKTEVLKYLTTQQIWPISEYRNSQMCSFMFGTLNIIFTHGSRPGLLIILKISFEALLSLGLKVPGDMHKNLRMLTFILNRHVIYPIYAGSMQSSVYNIDIWCEFIYFLKLQIGLAWKYESRYKRRT